MVKELVTRNNLVEDRPEGRARSASADVDLALADAPDHVHVDHRDRLIERASGMVDVVAGAEQAELLTGEGHEEDAAFLLRLGGHEARKLDDAGRA